ncbi:hypothetical protein [Vibrio splendidus]|uniref:hypothetical protein n=1 Tax=Vibrio splendidus TaxID=29497 RepID=UPI0013C31FBD|nr:hypothetical protein [Vibrio splendidus]
MARLTFFVALLGSIFSWLAVYYPFIKDHDELRLALVDVEYLSEVETLSLQFVLVNNGTSPVAVTNMFPMRKYANYASVHMEGKLLPFVVKPGEVQIKQLSIPFDEVDINAVGDSDCSPYRLILSFGLVSNEAEYIYNHIHILDFETFTNSQPSGVTMARYSDILHNLFDDATKLYGEKKQGRGTVLEGFKMGTKTSDCWLDI